ncbi:conserved Plasmodium protein, unknown function [Plasmodium relictum]|uniref:Uncharacterized protein n=1 Tax=Plasmodium relictum TaxID=85471 RepID=A0A1J1HBA4_PLARL|nr:conserved Plasmodium protein, unknown function [Plasmodium relictum]CRH01777.1 conserved Plasmodium protein, unknown function [Plasmodium relictum]
MGFLVQNEKVINKSYKGAYIENKINEKYLDCNKKKKFLYSIYDLNKNENDNNIYNTCKNLSTNNFYLSEINNANSSNNKYYSEVNTSNLNNMNNEKLLINKINFNDNNDSCAKEINLYNGHDNSNSLINDNNSNKTNNLFLNVKNDSFVNKSEFNNTNFQFINKRNSNKIDNESSLNENILKKSCQNSFISEKNLDNINKINKENSINKIENTQRLYNNEHKTNIDYSNSNKSNFIKLNNSFLNEYNLINGDILNKKYIKPFNNSAIEKDFIKNFFDSNNENNYFNVNNKQNEVIKKKIEKKIDENDYLFHAINELLEVGLKNECIPLFERLQQNLFFLVMLANIPNENFDDIESSSDY